MDNMLREFYDEGVGAYMDDIYIFSDTFHAHYRTIDSVLTKLDDNNMTVNIKKCQLFKNEAKLLGFIVSGSQVIPQPKKFQAL